VVFGDSVSSVETLDDMLFVGGSDILIHYREFWQVGPCLETAFWEADNFVLFQVVFYFDKRLPNVNFGVVFWMPGIRCVLVEIFIIEDCFGDRRFSRHFTGSDFKSIAILLDIHGLIEVQMQSMKACAHRALLQPID